MTIIASPHTDSVRGMQLACALALSHALTHELPEAYWVIHSTGSGMEGQISPDHGRPSTRIAAVEAWARFLGGPAVQHHRYAGYVAVEMGGPVVYRDATVRIWTHVSLADYDALMAPAGNAVQA